MKKKAEELFTRLRQVAPEDWISLKKGTLLIHLSDRDFLCDVFLQYRVDGETSPVMQYENIHGHKFWASATGWYYADEEIIDEIHEKYRPKLLQFKENVFVARTDKEIAEVLYKLYHIEISLKEIKDLKGTQIKELTTIGEYSIKLEK